MSFKVNSRQQISFNDSVFSLTAREKKALDNSWAKIFADEIFPNINFMCSSDQRLIHKEMKAVFVYFFIEQLSKIVLCNA